MTGGNRCYYGHLVTSSCYLAELSGRAKEVPEAAIFVIRFEIDCESPN